MFFAPSRAGRLRLAAVVLTLGLASVAALTGPVRSAPAAALAANRVAQAYAPAARTLVLYDTGGAWGWLGPTYATAVAKLATHFGSVVTHPVTRYAPGELSGYTAVVYLGSTYDEPLPAAFLDDVLATKIPVLWAYDNIWQLTRRAGNFTARYGFTYKQLDYAKVARVNYHGRSLSRDPANTSGIVDVWTTQRVQVMATAVRANGTSFPWATRSGTFTYLGEIPLAYTDHDDRYLAFCDLLFDALAPGTGSRRPATVRVEDVGPDTDPADLRAIGNYLAGRHIPYTVEVYPKARAAQAGPDGAPRDLTLAQRPQVVTVLNALRSRGATLLLHADRYRPGGLVTRYHPDAVLLDGPIALDDVSVPASAALPD